MGVIPFVFSTWIINKFEKLLFKTFGPNIKVNCIVKPLYMQLLHGRHLCTWSQVLEGWINFKYFCRKDGAY